MSDCTKSNEFAEAAPLFSWDELGAGIMARAQALAAHTEAPGMMTRSFLTPAHHSAAARLAAWMAEAGMSVRRDVVGNVIGRYEGIEPDAPALLTGSHFDTVPNGGIYDGILGILLPIACVARWHAQGRRFAHAIEVIGFAEEEGVRFKATLLGSRAIAGAFDLRVLDHTDAAGVTMRQAIDTAGLGYSCADLGAAAMDPARMLGFLEVHIEQGPVLLDAGLALGIVTGIAGATRMQVEVSGVAGHAGTVPMAGRRDAAMAAAEIALVIEQRCGGVEGLVGTVGQFDVPGGAANVVPGRALFSIDVRAEQDGQREAAVADILAAIDRIAARRGVATQVRQTHEARSVPCAPALCRQLDAALRRAGLPARRLPSGAGHDAMVIAARTDMAMLFVRCGNGGISHNPLETMTAEDAALAARVASDFIEHFQPSGSNDHKEYPA
ncbi:MULTISPECIES: allantoate amidohydrolase [unclassified Duganella]|uniref:allantoate amidohydrolase n=1 Tax=unclassified Duganella TaxID=2636909 RepID=UPI000E352EE4|nr:MULTISPECIES: allantoate amidohydrolase [unclassified Duganella]RFP09367.1 allantoate amidohydrolase [Duganella sp. BJB475]RFP25476.1 allantoate amidohydrolase [Duganella sp. BJB476]